MAMAVTVRRSRREYEKQTRSWRVEAGWAGQLASDSGGGGASTSDWRLRDTWTSTANISSRVW